MAVNFEAKQHDLVGDAVTLATLLDDTYTRLAQFGAEVLQCPAFTDEIIQSQASAAQLDAADWATLTARFAELLAWIDAVGEFRQDILRKARR